MRTVVVAASATWVLFALFSGAVHAQSCSHYLNATNGDDKNSGARPELAVRSFEYAFRTFPSESIVCMTAGEYFHSLDSDGIQLTGSELDGKSMQFVLQSFAGATEVAFTEDELRIDIGTGRLEFVAGSASALRLGVGAVNSPQVYPANATFLHTFILKTGLLDVSGVDFTIGASVGNPGFERDGIETYAAPDSATIGRGTGSVTGAFAFEEAPRSLAYIGAGDRTAGDEIPPLLSRLTFNHTDGVATVSRTLSFVPGAHIELAGAGDARVESSVSISSAASSTLLVTGSGVLDMSGRFAPIIDGDIDRLAHVNSDGRLILRHLDVSGTGGAQNRVADIVNSSTGLLEVHTAEAGPGVHLTLRNEAAGSCSLGSAAFSTVVEANLLNENDGYCFLEGGTTLSGDVINRGRVTVRGPLEFATRIENTGTIDLQDDATISGTLVNQGEIELGSHTLSISGTGPHDNAGQIISTNAAGALLLAASTSIVGDGKFPDLISSSGTHRVSGSTINGRVEIQAGADLTLVAEEIGGLLRIEGGAALVNVARAAALEVLSGSLVLDRDLMVGDYTQQSGASIDLSARTLALTGSFNRLGGSFTSNGGGLLFRGTSIQSLTPGPDLEVDNMRIESTHVRLTSGPLHVRDSLVVSTGSTLQLFDYILRLSGERTVLSNEGEISTSITGALVFGGPAGATHRMTGSGLLGNVEIGMEDEDDVVLVENADLRQGGMLTLESGRLRLSAGSTYSLVSTRGAPFIRRNLGDENGDGEPAGKAIEANTAERGSFLSPDGGFHLEYFGTLEGEAATGAEFLSGQIVDLRILISGPAGIPATLSLSSNLSFTGALELAESAILDLGEGELTATGSGLTHDVWGRIESSSGAFVITGSSVTTRGREDSPSSIEMLRISSEGLVATLALQSIGRLLEVRSGRLNLHLQGSSLDSFGTVQKVLVDEGGELVLSSTVRVLGSVDLSGDLDLSEHDLIMESGASFVASNPTVIAPGRGGSVVFSGQGQLRAPGTSVPRLRIESSADSRLSLTGDLRISESLVIEAGILDLSTHTLAIEGGSWELLGGHIAGSGAILIAGPVDVALTSDYAIPNLTLNTLREQDRLSLRSTTDSSHQFIVEELLSMERGVLDLGLIDVVVGRLGSTSRLSYEGGAFSMVTGEEVSDNANGELEVTDTILDFVEPLRLANIRITGSARFRSESAPLEIYRQITFLDGMLENIDSSDVRLADETRVVRRGSGTFRTRPTLENVINLYYEVRGANLGVLETGPEMPGAAGIRSLTVDAGVNIVRLSEATGVRETLRIDSGALDPNGHALRVDAGATVHYDHSTLNLPTFAGGSFQAAGPVRLIYSGGRNISSSDLTFPSDADVSELVVAVGNVDGDEAAFILHANRRFDNLVIESGNAVSGADLNGRSIIVDSNVYVRSGVIRSDTEAIMEVGDSLVVASGASIRDVVRVLSRGHTEIHGVFAGFVLRAFGNVRVTGELGTIDGEPTAAADLVVDGLPNLEFSGSDQILRLERADDNPESIDDAVNRFIMTSSGVVRIESRADAPFTLGVNHLELRSGLLETGLNDLRLPHDGPGLSREEAANSHVIGRISRHLRPEAPGSNGARAKRFEFPVGAGDSETSYRPLFISFPEDDPLAASSVITVGHSGSLPGGFLGFPIDGGEGVLIGDASGFHWTLSAQPALAASQSYILGMIGTGYDSYSAARNLRLIHRPHGREWDQSWRLAGSSTQHDNAVVTLNDRPVPFIQVERTNNGIPSEPEIYAIGIDASQMDFARLQVANLLGRNGLAANVMVDDSLAARGLRFGEATRYFRAQPGIREIQLVAENGTTIVQEMLEFEAGRDYLIAGLTDGPTGQPVLVLQEAQAIPTMEAKQDVSLALFHGIPDAPPLSLRSRDDGETLFSGVPFAELSDGYVALAAENTGFDVISTTSSETMFSLRSELSGHAGETINALAAGYLNPFSYGASEEGRLVLFTNHGRAVHSGVQVEAEEPAEIPASFVLRGNYPNPFNPSTRVVFDLPESAEVSLEVFDMLGRMVMRLSTQRLSAGRHAIHVDAWELPSGVYLYRVSARGASTYTGSGKMTLVR